MLVLLCVQKPVLDSPTNRSLHDPSHILQRWRDRRMLLDACDNAIHEGLQRRKPLVIPFLAIFSKLAPKKLFCRFEKGSQLIDCRPLLRSVLKTSYLQAQQNVVAAPDDLIVLHRERATRSHRTPRTCLECLRGQALGPPLLQKGLAGEQDDLICRRTGRGGLRGINCKEKVHGTSVPHRVRVL